MRSLRKKDRDVLTYLRDAEQPLYPTRIDVPGRVFHRLGLAAVFRCLARLEVRGLVGTVPGQQFPGGFRRLMFFVTEEGLSA